MVNDGSVVNDPRFNLEVVSHERRELAFDEGAVAANNIFFVDVRVVLLAHDCGCGQVIEYQQSLLKKWQKKITEDEAFKDDPVAIFLSLSLSPPRHQQGTLGRGEGWKLIPQSDVEEMIFSSMSQWSTWTVSATKDGMWQRRMAAFPRITWSSDTYVEYDCNTTNHRTSFLFFNYTLVGKPTLSYLNPSDCLTIWNVLKANFEWEPFLYFKFK